MLNGFRRETNNNSRIGKSKKLHDSDAKTRTGCFERANVNDRDEKLKSHFYSRKK